MTDKREPKIDNRVKYSVTRNVGETIVIGDKIEVTLVQIQFHQNQARIGINAPREVSVFRKELLQAIMKENVRASSAPMSIDLPSKLPTVQKKADLEK